MMARHLNQKIPISHCARISFVLTIFGINPSVSNLDFENTFETNSNYVGFFDSAGRLTKTKTFVIKYFEPMITLLSVMVLPEFCNLLMFCSKAHAVRSIRSQHFVSVNYFYSTSRSNAGINRLNFNHREMIGSNLNDISNQKKSH